jgi:RNA polymerase sigma-70 factor (ECF subfamily)
LARRGVLARVRSGRNRFPGIHSPNNSADPFYSRPGPTGAEVSSQIHHLDQSPGWRGIKRHGLDMIRMRNIRAGRSARDADPSRHMVQHSTRTAERHDDWRDFEAVALPHLERLFRLALWLERDRDVAEDLVQETFAQALQSFHRFEPGTNCRAWLVSILQHLRSNRRRALARLPVLQDTEEQIAETVAYEPPTPQGITEEEVLIALRRLPQGFQEIILLSDVEQFSYKEIAEVLGIPMGTVMSRLHRARKLLRTELAAYANAHGIGRGRDAGTGRGRLPSTG